MAALMALAALTGCAQPPSRFEPCPLIPAHPCDQRITADEARRVARESGLGPGITAWVTEFGWRVDPQRPGGGFHAWSVQNTTDAGGEGDAAWAYGSAAIVDAADGRLVEMLAWRL